MLFKTKTVFIALILASLLLNSTVNAQSAKMINPQYITGIDTFDTLINRLHGSVVFVDMWATWCKPCVSELQDKKHIDAFKAYAIKNNVAIVYLSLDRNEKSWRSFVDAHQLYGYHVLVTDTLLKELRERFSISQLGTIHYVKKGLPLPRHMIIDRNGVIADSTAAAQGSLSVYNKINTLL